MNPIAYYGNLLLSGTLSGSAAATTNPVRLVSDGSINVTYALTSATVTQSGSVLVSLTVSGAPVALSIPRCEIPSGYTLKLQSMSNPVTEAGLVTVVSAFFNAETFSFLSGFAAPTAALYWRVLLSGVSGLSVAEAAEVQLALVSANLGAPQVGVERTHKRQFARVEIPGGQPFVRRDGPMLERSRYVLVGVSGGSGIEGAADQATLEAFVEAVNGGDAFTLVDDLARSYWAELLDVDVVVGDTAGVHGWSLTFQEIQVD